MTELESLEHEPIRVPVLYQLGWFRWLPHAALDFEMILNQFSEIARSELLATQNILHARRIGIDLDRGEDPETLVASLPEAPAWEPAAPPSDDDRDPDDPDHDPVQAFEEDVAERAARVAEHDVLTTRMGLAPVRTAEQVLDLMVAVGLVQAEARGDEEVLRLAADPPLPTEALPMTPEEGAAEDRVRWQSRYARLSQAVLRQFLDEDGAIAQTSLPSSLDRLAAATASDPEDVRHAVLVLLDEGDFAALRHGRPVDVERLESHQRFDLVLDPERFYADRLSIQLNSPVDRPEA